MVKKKSVKSSNIKSSKGKISQGLAIVCLLLNIIIMPGIGTLIGGKTREGVWQLVLFWIGIILLIILVGIPLIIISWIWALISGIKLVQESK
jgi:TM2 domain-containing membrane protein YozV